MGAQLMAVVAQGHGGRVYLDPTPEQTAVAESAQPDWKPNGSLPHNPRDFKTPNYGMTTFADLFTSRQLVALTTFSDLVKEARSQVLRDAVIAGLPDDGVSYADGGSGAPAYADAVATYLTFGVSRMSDINNSFCMWENTKTQVRHLFTKQAIPMLWDYAEANVFSKSAGDYAVSLGTLLKSLEATPAIGRGKARQVDAVNAVRDLTSPVFSTDPPYYDNIGYADLSDFFYVWLRRSLEDVYPSLFGTLLTPKAAELVATPYRFDGSKERAQEFFEHGLGDVFAGMRANGNPEYPTTIFYAFKQSESEDNDEPPSSGGPSVASTGWETMLSGLLRAGFQINGTWPMRSELGNRMLASGTNALASSIVLVCRPRPVSAPIATRAEFVRALQRELPAALRALQHGNIAPVDLAQAAIGPGMAVYSRYARVLEADGTAMPVRTALQLINATLDTTVAGNHDRETRWAIDWFSQYGFNEGAYGTAETLATAKAVSMAGLVTAGIVESGRGKVRLLRPDELSLDWDPATDTLLTVWETVHHIIRALLGEGGGEDAAAALIARTGATGESARDLAYHLYLTCERKNWSQEARSYNTLVTTWPELTSRMAQQAALSDEQLPLSVD